MTDLVEIKPDLHDVDIHLAYAVSGNFTGSPVYKKACCFLHKDAFSKLIIAIDMARLLGYRLKIFDAFRPQKAQELLWNHTPDPTFLADPKRGSHHTRGIAIDLTLVDRDTGLELDMGTAFDAFTPLSFHTDLSIGSVAFKNRVTLLGLMTAAGFDYYDKEWWHYQLFSPRDYPLILNGEEADLIMNDSASSVRV